LGRVNFIKGEITMNVKQLREIIMEKMELGKDTTKGCQELAKLNLQARELGIVSAERRMAQMPDDLIVVKKGSGYVLQKKTE
jgi:hypothetical protein